MLALTVAYGAYLGHVDYFESVAGKALETFNESVFLVDQYLLVLLHGLILEAKLKEALSDTLILLTGLLILLNFIIIIGSTVRSCYHNLKLKKLKHRNKRIFEQQLARRKSHHAQGNAIKKKFMTGLDQGAETRQ